VSASSYLSALGLFHVCHASPLKFGHKVHDDEAETFILKDSMPLLLGAAASAAPELDHQHEEHQTSDHHHQAFAR